MDLVAEVEAIEDKSSRGEIFYSKSELGVESSSIIPRFRFWSFYPSERKAFEHNK